MLSTFIVENLREITLANFKVIWLLVKGNLRVWHLLVVVKVFSVKIVRAQTLFGKGLGMRLWRITTCGDIMTGYVLLFRTVGWLGRGIHLGDCRLTRNDFPTALHTLQTM